MDTSTGITDAQHPCDWSVLPQLERFERYEQRVFMLRRWAIREFCKTKPMDGSAIEPAAAVPVAQGVAGDFCKTKPMPEVVPPETTAPEAKDGIAQVFCKTKPMQTLVSSASVLESKSKDMRYLDIHENDEFDEAQLAAWIKQASLLPGERM